MTQPAGIVDLALALLIGVGSYCLGRLVVGVAARRSSHYGVNVGHVLMALSMVGMLEPRWAVAPRLVWAVLFGVMGAWFAGLALRSVLGAASATARHYGIHAVMCGAMVYMARIATSGVRAGRPAGDPLVTAAFVVVLLTSAVWQLDGLARLRPAGSAAMAIAGPAPAPMASRPWLAPRLEAGCHVAMCLVMAYMLVVML